MSTVTKKQVIHTELAPRAIGPYSQAIQGGGFVFTAGQVALDPQTGELVGSSVEAQTHQALINLQHVLEAASSGMPYVVKTTVFLKDMGDFAKMNAVYAESFSGEAPARSTVAVAALPKGALVEIEAIALLKHGEGS